MLHSDGPSIHPVRLTIFFSPYLATQPPWHRISSNKPHYSLHYYFFFKLTVKPFLLHTLHIHFYSCFYIPHNFLFSSLLNKLYHSFSQYSSYIPPCPHNSMSYSFFYITHNFISYSALYKPHKYMSYSFFYITHKSLSNSVFNKPHKSMSYSCFYIPHNFLSFYIQFNTHF